MDVQSAIGTAFQAIAETDPDGLILLDATSAVLYANQQVRTFFDEELFVQGADIGELDLHLRQETASTGLQGDGVTALCKRADGHAKVFVAISQQRTYQLRATPLSIPVEPANLVLLRLREVAAVLEPMGRMAEPGRHLSADSDDLSQALRLVAQIAATLIKVNRVSVWTFSNDRLTLARRCLFEDGAASQPSGPRLRASDSPRHFEVLLAGEVLQVEDTSADSIAEQLKGLYLESQKARSMLAVPITIEGQVYGAITHEMTSQVRRWQQEDVELAELVAHMAALVLDRRLRQQAEVVLRHSEKRYRELFENAPIGMVRISLDSTITAANEKAQEIFGASSPQDMIGLDLVGSPLSETELWKVLQRVLETGKPFVGSGHWITRFGTEARIRGHFTPEVDPSGAMESVLAVVEDVTAQHQAELAIRHAQKLESLGLMAGGLAHQFNNLLQGILGHSELAAFSLPEGSPVRKNLDCIANAAVDASGLTRQMSAFAGGGNKQIVTLDLTEIADRTLTLLDFPQAAPYEVVTDWSMLPVTLAGDLSQINQVALNLIQNAVEAQGSRGGQITVSTSVEDLSSEQIKAIRFGSVQDSGRYAALRVSDQGLGMTQDTIDKIFDPFFTTKFVGRGLGLAAVIGIVKGHEGGISVCSEPGHGTTIEVVLPMFDSVARSPHSRQSAKDPQKVRVSKDRLLLVEDDPAVGLACRLLLTKAGYKVEHAVTGEQGVEIFRADQSFAAVLTDLTLPDMAGEKVLVEIQELNPATPVLIISGHSPQEMKERCRGLPVARFVQKPWTGKELTAAVAAVLAN